MDRDNEARRLQPRSARGGGALRRGPKLLTFPAPGTDDEPVDESRWARLGVVWGCLSLLGAALLTFFGGPRRAPKAVDGALEQELAWLIVDVVDLIELLRARRGRPPTEAEIAPKLDRRLSFVQRGEEYAVVATSDGLSLYYVSEEPLEEWIARRALLADGEEAAAG